MKSYSSLGEVLVLSQIMNIKLPSFVVLERKEVKRYFCFVLESTEVYSPSILALQTFYLRLFMWWM
jgi:hypothetical protein